MTRFFLSIFTIFIVGCGSENSSPSTITSKESPASNDKPQIEWEMVRSKLSKKGAIVESYRNKAIYNDEYIENYEKKFDAYWLAVEKDIGALSQGTYDHLLPKPFSIGYPIRSIENEFLIDKAREKKFAYFPDWSKAEFSFDVGEHSYPTEVWRGSVDIEIQGSIEGINEIELSKFMRIDTSSDSFESKRLTAELKTWSDGRFLIVFNSIDHTKVSPDKREQTKVLAILECYTKDYRSIDIKCDNGTTIDKQDVQMLTTQGDRMNA